MEYTIQHTYIRSIAIKKDIVPRWEQYRAQHPETNLNRLLNELLRAHLDREEPCATMTRT